MNVLNRVDKLCDLISSTPDQRFNSHKSLHKTVYLLQRAGEDFGYDFSYEMGKGMVSSTLEEDLEIAKSWRVISENDNGKQGIEVHYSGKLPRKILSPRVSKLITILIGEDKRTLHVLADINLLQQNDYKKRELEQKVRELNPYQNSSFISRAFQLYRDLVDYFPLAINSA